MFPNHFSFLWGEVALYSFVVLLITGIYLTFFFEGSQQELVYDGSYEPLQGVEVSAAYESVLRISFDVKGGLLIRQMHHWAALVFVGAIALHMARVFFTGAFRRPRELNWVVGVLLLLLALAAGFTGYSLPDDLLSGTGLRITQAIILAIPFDRRAARRTCSSAASGRAPTSSAGSTRCTSCSSRRLIVALLAVHLALVWRQKHTQFRARGAPSATSSASACGRVRDEVDRAAVPRRRRDHRDGRAVPRQRGLAVRPVRHRRGDVVLATRLVHRLPRGLAAPVPAVGDAGRSAS